MSEAWYKKAKNEAKELTLKKRMENWYEERTNKHINLVKKYCEKIADNFEEFEELRKRAKVHDDSKFKSPEKSPYVFITWKYKCLDEGWDFEECNPPEDMDKKMNEATKHHVLYNSHHPEYHLSEKDKKGDILNEGNRDKPPAKALDVTAMPRLDIAEMCADWMAMSEERGNSPKSWADKNIGVRWEFNDDQKYLIYEILNEVWKDAK